MWAAGGMGAPWYHGVCRHPLKAVGGEQSMAPSVSPWYELARPTTCTKQCLVNARDAPGAALGRPCNAAG
jgi:hypothetical protein